MMISKPRRGSRRLAILILPFIQTLGMAEDAYPWENYTVFQWRETRARFGAGISSFIVGPKQDTAAVLSLRYRLSPAPWPISDARPWRLGPIPLRVWLEAGGLLPHNGSTLRDVTKQVDASTTDQADVKLRWQTHLALGSEIPLGKQRWLVPDFALGFAVGALTTNFLSQTRYGYTQSGFSYANTEYLFGRKERLAWSPYVRFGFNLFSDRFVSVRFLAGYVRYSHEQNLDLNYSQAAQNSHRQSFDLSLKGWQIQPMIEIKCLWPSAVHVPLLPQRLPPWLLPSYTTEEVSPWVAPPEAAKDRRYNQPGRAPVGNVMFQYKNRWVDRVEIIGDFNDWTPERMIKDRSGVWVLVKDVPPGTFRYNYLLNGQKEILDPWNKNVDENSRRHGSSVVIVH